MLPDFENILHRVPDPLALLNREWRLIYLNRAAEEILGGGDLLGCVIWDLFPAAIGSELHSSLLDVPVNGETVEKILRPSEYGLETESWFRLRAYPVDEWIAVIAWDATEFQRAESEREELLDTCTEVSQAFQKALLPPALPEIAGVEIGAEYVAVGAGLEVGGDFYDVFAIENDGWAFVIGDVAGKGPEAASLTSFARYTIRAAAMRLKRPHLVLGALNEEIRRQTSGERLFTAVYGELEPGSGGDGAIIRISCAGHPSPVILRSGGEVEWLSGTGMILGEFEDPKLASEEFALRPGDAVVFYTDGVTEARNEAGAFFEMDSLVGVVGECAGLSAPQIADEIKSKALAFQNGIARDDIAVLVLRVSDRER